MCVVSMVGEHYLDRIRSLPGTPSPWKDYDPSILPNPTFPTRVQFNDFEAVNRKEFEELKRIVLEMKELLVKAKKYDEETGQKNCENDQKYVLIRGLADLLGIDLSDVIGEKKS